MAAAIDAVDFIEELRLRRWAIENYVPMDQRDDLHPIIVHEMQRIDARREVTVDDVVTPFDNSVTESVPALSRETTEVIEEVSEPIAEMSVPEVQIPVISRIEPQPRVFTSNIVPLLPDFEMLHGPHELLLPHMRSRTPVDNGELHYT